MGDKLKPERKKPNPWAVFFRTNKGKFANKEDSLSDYRADFQVKMVKLLSRVEAERWDNKRKREEYQKIIYRYFHAAQKKAGNNSPKNKDDMSLAINKMLKKSASTRATLSAITKISPSILASQKKKANAALAKQKKKDKEKLAK